MSRKPHVARLSLCLILLGLVAAVPAIAGSAVIGSVAGSMNATVGGQTLLPNTTLFSGDNLQVKDGVAVVALGSASRIVFGHDTVASFLRDSNEVTVLLSQGNVSVFHDGAGMPVRMKMGDVSVVPVAGFKTLGEVAMLNGDVMVSAKDGVLRVEGSGPAVNVAKGKTITVHPTANAPQGGGGKAPGGSRCCGSNVWGIAGTAVGAGAIVVAAIAVSRAGNAKDSANTASSEAAAAAAAAATATSAANSAASAAAAAANAVGCALNTLAGEEGEPSPYTPTGGAVCP